MLTGKQLAIIMGALAAYLTDMSITIDDPRLKVVLSAAVSAYIDATSES